jgi:hypothetical protein
MSLATTFDTIFNLGIGLSLFKRKDRHNLHDYIPRHIDEEENNTNWEDVEEVGDDGINWNELEEVEDDDAGWDNVEDNQDETPYNPRPVHKWRKRIWLAGTIISVILVGSLILYWLIILPVKNLQNYPQINGKGLNVQLQVKNTGSVIPAYDVTVQSPDSSNLHILKGDTLNVTWNIFQFPGSAPRLKLIGVTSQFANQEQEQNIKVDPLNRSLQFKDDDDVYFNSWTRSPLMSISTVSCFVPLGQISDPSIYTLTITATPAGKCSYTFVQQK